MILKFFNDFRPQSCESFHDPVVGISRNRRFIRGLYGRNKSLEMWLFAQREVEIIRYQEIDECFVSLLNIDLQMEELTLQRDQ